jgi:transcriptional regulator with XRE-family HTH domain
VEIVRRRLSSSQFGSFSLPEGGHRDPDLLLLGRALRRLREQRRVSVDELAGAIDIPRQRIDALESGRLDPTYELLLALADGLGVRASALVILAERLKQSGEH